MREAQQKIATAVKNQSKTWQNTFNGSNVKKKILAIETSCDECSASVVEVGNTAASVHVLSNVIFSQIDLHKRFGGIVPEVASRNHLEMLSPVVDEALEKASVKFTDLSAIAVTQGPGLIGALLVGLSAAKSYAYALKIPLITVNHLEGHLHSIFIAGQKSCTQPTPAQMPMLTCLVSGGHTNLYIVRGLPPQSLGAEKLSESRDDAAGEAFDKCAKLLGLPYPGGIYLDRLAKSGNKTAFDFPRPLPGKQDIEFSFSGLKTAVLTEIKKQGFVPHVFGNIDASKLPADKLLADFCASVQESITQTLVRKMRIAIEQTGAKSLAVVGGVSANSRLRELLAEKIGAKFRIPILIPDHEYCTDNAAMIGACAAFKLERGEALSFDELLSANAYSS